MNKFSIVGVLVAGTIIATASAAGAVCKERLYPSEAQGRNAWAEMWGYLMPGQADTLKSQGLYVEFTTGCYRLASGGPCNPVIPVTVNGAPDLSLMTADFCPQYDCYTPSQRILVEGGYVGIEDAAKDESRAILTLASDASPENADFTAQSVESFTSAPIMEDIFVLEGENGERLEVTGGHPLVLGDGTVVPAKVLQEGDALYGEKGQAVRLVRVSSYHYDGQVWNVQLQSREKADNIMVAEGFLAGTMLFQEQWGHESFRLFVRDTVNAEAILADM